MNNSAKQVRLMLNYRQEGDGRNRKITYPLFDSFKMLRHLRTVDLDKIYEIDKFELTIFPGSRVMYKLDLRKNHKSGFKTMPISEIPRGIHTVKLGETFENEKIELRIMFHFDGVTPLITGYLIKKPIDSQGSVEKSIFDFPIELLFSTDSLWSRFLGKRKRLLMKYNWKEDKILYGPFKKPLNKDIKFKIETIRYSNEFVTFIHELE